MSLRFVASLALLAAVGPAFAQTAPASRVLAIGGSVTEIVVALGETDRLVGRDSTSTWPESILALPEVGYVRRLSAEGVLAISPDLIIAEHDAGPPEAVDVLKAAAIPFVSVPAAQDGAAVLDKITMVAEALGVPEKGNALKAQVSAGLAQAAVRAALVTKPQRVLFILSMEGGRVMAGGKGTSAEGIIQMAGGINAVSGFDGYKQMTDEAVLQAAPDVVVMMDRGGDHSAAAAELFALPALSISPAAAGQRLIKMDGLLLLGFGPRTPEAALALNAAIYGAAP